MKEKKEKETTKNSQTYFFQIDQNNSGGSFTTNDTLCHRLFIEADNEREACKKAEELGCYWNGCDEGYDCSCCGDRWYRPSGHVDLEKISDWEVYILHSEKDKPLGESEDAWHKKYGAYDVSKAPSWKNASVKGWKQFAGKIKFSSIEDYAQFMANEYGWTKPDARIFYKNGDIKEINKQT